MNITLEDWDSKLGEYATMNAALDVWDVPPSIMLAVHCSNPKHTAEDHPVLQFFQLPVADFLWNDRSPVDVIEAMKQVQSIDPLPLPRPPLSVVGLVFVGEAWAMTVPKDQVKSAEDWLESNTVKEHPTRKECRVISAVDADGEVYAITHIRGEEEPREILSTRNGADPGGAVPRALAELLAAFLGNHEVAYKGNYGKVTDLTHDSD